MPYYAFGFMVFTFASVGLPGTTGFIGEILILMAAFKINGFMALGLATGMVLGAAYALWLYRRVIFGALTKTELKKMMDLTKIEKMVLAPLVATVVIFGVYPQPLLDISDKSVARLLASYQRGLTYAERQTSPENILNAQEIIKANLKPKLTKEPFAKSSDKDTI